MGTVQFDESVTSPPSVLHGMDDFELRVGKWPKAMAGFRKTLAGTTQRFSDWHAL
jgi:hypothetical protein